MPAAAANASPSDLVHQLGELKITSPEFTELLKSVLYGRNYAEFAASLKGHEVLSFIDIMDEVSFGLNQSLVLAVTFELDVRHWEPCRQIAICTAKGYVH